MSASKDSLPELPERKRRSVTTHGWGTISVNVFTADQMRDIRLAGYRAGLERAAELAQAFATCGCNGKWGRCNEDDMPLSIAAAIRSEKQR